jgi:hypothetical protein
MLNTLLTQIERTLPLNQLYIDLTNDEHVKNEQIQKNEDIAEALKNMMPDSLSSEQKLQFLSQMMEILPYRNYPSVIEEIKREVSTYE